METDIFLGIDMGSTGLKVVAYEAGSGRPLASSGGPLPWAHTPGGGCELAGEAIAAALFQALRAVTRQLGSRCAKVRAIGCTGHGAGLYALDAQRRLLRGVAVASTDQRGAARARAIGRAGGEALAAEVGCRPWSGQPAAIGAELRASGLLPPGEVRHLLFAKDYLCFLLTGAIATDASDASTAGLIELATGRWSANAFAAAGLADWLEAAAPLVPSGSVVGGLCAPWARDCGLAAELPVVTGAIDLLASLVAVGAEANGQAVAVFGTWCVNSAIGPARTPLPPVGGVVNFGSADRRLYLENSPSSMANLAWLATTLGFNHVAEVVDCAMAAPLGAAGLRFLPFINGGDAPPNASAGFVGLRAHHDRSHMARAAVDAVAAQHARHLKRLAALGLVAPGQVAALGGGARDARLVRLLAGFLGHPVVRCGDDETGARGAALYAARSQGLGPLPTEGELIAPDPRQQAAHAEHFASFNEMIDGLMPTFARIANSHAEAQA